MDIDEILKSVDETIDKPFVTAQFGNNWKEYAMETMTKEDLIQIAWRQGRKAILLKRLLEQAIK